MNYAFDWGDTLFPVEQHHDLWAMARALAAGGHEVSIISWCGANDGANGVEEKRLIAESGIPWKRVVGFCGAPEVTLAIENDGAAEFQIGKAKARWMREVGASVIFDDNPHVCRGVRSVGLTAYQVMRK